MTPLTNTDGISNGAAEPAACPSSVQRSRVILVDGSRPERDLLKVLLEFLRQEGQYATALRPDLVLLDLNLPRKNGTEVLAEMRADPLLRAIPVAVLNNPEGGVRRSALLRAGCQLLCHQTGRAYRIPRGDRGRPGFLAGGRAFPIQGRRMESAIEDSPERLAELSAVREPSDLFVVSRFSATKKAGRKRVEVATSPHGDDFGTAPSDIRGRSAPQSVILAFGYPDPVAAAMDASGETIAQRAPVVGGT
jgi:CheY-like chemotaxis protein